MTSLDLFVVMSEVVEDLYSHLADPAVQKYWCYLLTLLVALSVVLWLQDMFVILDENFHILSKVLAVDPHDQLLALETFLCSLSLANVSKVLQIHCETLSVNLFLMVWIQCFYLPSASSANLMKLLQIHS